MPRRNLVWIAAVSGLSLFCWAAAQGGLAPPRGPLHVVKGLPGNEQDYERMGLLVDVLHHVEQNYVHSLNEEDRRKFMDAALNAGLQTLDQHSAYINPKEYRQFTKQSDGAFGGVGVQIVVNPQNKRLTVISPIIGTPAYQAGIKPGDEIEKIDGVPTQGMTSDDAVDKIQGPPGSKIVLTVRPRGGEKPRDVALVRSLIEVECVLGDTRDGDKHWEWMIDKSSRIGYLRLTQFNKKSLPEMKAALEKLQEQGVRGLVIDLRNNPGGLLDAAVDLADLFLTAGKIVSVEGRTRAPQTYEAKAAGTFLEPAAEHPMVVLVDGHSASASEILAAALQDHHRAVVVGERSYGKGSVQNLIPMDERNGKSALKLTTAKYIRPSGKNIHRFPESKEEDEWGVKPDVEVKLTPTEELEYWQGRRDRDVVRDVESPAAVARKLSELPLAVGTAWTATVPVGGMVFPVQVAAAGAHLPVLPRPFHDRTLEKAMEILRGKLGPAPAAAAAR
jgi:carboxyl-terminal processing protease